MGRATWLCAAVVFAGCAHAAPRASVASGGAARDAHASPASTAQRLGPLEPQATIQSTTTSLDGAHVALTTTRPTGVQVFVDGVAEPVVGAIVPAAGGVAIAEHAGVAAYWATTPARGPFLVFRGRELPLEIEEGGEIRIVPMAAPAVSPDGRHVAAWARVEDRNRGTRTVLWLDGRAIGQFTGVRELVGFDPSGQHVAAIIDVPGGVAVWVDGWERSGYVTVNSGSVRWHPDGTVSFLARRAQHAVLFHRDREIVLAANATLLSAPDARGRVAYVIVAAQQQQVLLDDRIVASHDDVTDLDFVGGRLRLVGRDGARTHVSLVGVGALSPASAIASDTYAEREGCALYVAVVPVSGAPTPEVTAVAGATLADVGPLGTFVVQESLPGQGACPSRRWGPFDVVGAPRWLSAGTPAFIARGPEGPETAHLHVGDRHVSLGALPRGLEGATITEDGRVEHLAEVDGALVRVTRDARDLRPTAVLLGPARLPAPVSRALTRHVIAELPPGTVVQASIDPDGDRLAALFTVGAVRRLVVGPATRVLADVLAHLGDGPEVAARDAGALPDGAENRLLPAQELLSPPVLRDGHVVYGAWDATARSMVVRRDGQLVGAFEQQRTVEVGSGGAWWTAPATDGRSWSAHWGPASLSVPLGLASGGRFVPAPGGRRWAARTADDPHQLVVDGETLARGSAMTDPLWSPQAAHVLVAAIAHPGNGRWSVLVDGRAGAEEPAAILPLAIADDGTISYGVQRPGAMEVVVGGRRSGPWANVAWASARIDDTGRHVALLALDRSGETVVLLDGEELRRDIADATLCAFAAGTGALAWVGQVGGADVLLVDRTVAGGAGHIPPASVRWSPDGNTLAWLGARRAPDRGTTWTVHVGDVAHGPYDDVSPAGVTFGREGHAAWVARTGAMWSLWVDGARVASFDDVAQAPSWGEGGSISLLVFEARRLVSLRFRPAPFPAPGPVLRSGA